MQTAEFWKRVTMDDSGFLPRLIQVLQSHTVRFAVIGGQGVNAFVDPLVSLDLDLVIAIEDRIRAIEALSKAFRVDRFPHSVNISEQGSSLRVQIRTDPRYDGFVEHATPRDVLGWRLPVAAIADILQGKIWAAEDPTRRASERLKDLTDIARIIEKFPELRSSVPKPLLARLA